MEGIPFLAILLGSLIIYLFFIVPYWIFQKVRNKKIRFRSIVIGGSGSILIISFYQAIIYWNYGEEYDSVAEGFFFDYFSNFLIVIIIINILAYYIMRGTYPWKEEKPSTITTKPEQTITESKPKPKQIVEESKPSTKPEKTLEEPEPASSKPEQPVEKPMPEEEKYEPKKKATQLEKCPHCSGELSELIHYKLKAGDSAQCEFCSKMILP